MRVSRKRTAVRNASTRWGRVPNHRRLRTATRRTARHRAESGDAVRVLEAPGPARALAHTIARIIPLPLVRHGIAARDQHPARALRTRHDASVRKSLVASARARLAAGHYDLPHVRGRIVDALLREIRRP